MSVTITTTETKVGLATSADSVDLTTSESDVNVTVNTEPASWGMLTGTLSDQVDLQTALAAKVASTDLASTADSAKGAALVGYLASGTGAVGRTLASRLVDVINVRDYGATGDGTTDDTAAIQAAIDANKGKTVLVPHGSYVIAGLLLSGSTYDGTQLLCEGELKLKANGGSTNFGGAWVGLIVQSCDRVRLRLAFDGNRANMTASEFIYCLGVAGASNLTIESFRAREIRGDGIYLNQSSWTASGTNTNGVHIGQVMVTNSANDGRNAVSIISAANVTIGSLLSYQVGGTVNGVVEPGGLDIEPSQSYHSVSNVSVGALTVVTAGTSGLAIQGVAGSATTHHVTVARASITNTAAATLTDGASNTTRTPNHVLLVRNATDVTVSGVGRFTNAYGDGVIVTQSARVNLDFTVSHVTMNRIGSEASETGVSQSNIRLLVDDIGQYAVRTGNLTDCRISGRATTPQSTLYPGGRFAVAALQSGGTQTRVQYSVDVPYHANWTRSYRNDATFPVSFTDCTIRDCDVSGSSWSAVAGAGDMAVQRLNMKGQTDRTAAPTGGAWLQGQVVWNTGAAASGTVGWVCVTAGSPGTWKAFGTIAA